MAGDRFMKCQIRQAVLAVQTCRAKVDPESSGNLAVDRSRAAIRGRRAGLFFGRKAFHLHVRIYDLIKSVRHLRSHPVESALNESHDLGPPLVAFGELITPIL